jgi:hypothetical protein
VAIGHQGQQQVAHLTSAAAICDDSFTSTPAVSFAQIAAVPIPLYLAFDEATYYEGAVLVVDGGRTGARQRARGSAALSRIAAFERWRPGRP